MYRLNSMLLLAVIAGCGKSNDSNGDSNADSNGDTTAFAPKTGTWTGSAVTTVSNTCTSPAPSAPTLAIKSVGTDSFLLTDTSSESGMIRMCTLDGLAFTCAQVDVSIPVGDNATLRIVVDVTGTFTDDSNLTMSSAVAQSCVGSSCAALAENQGATWPCASEFTNTATYTGP